MKELEELRNYINFPMEKPAILNEMARKVEGKPTVHQGGFHRLLDENSIEILATNTWQKIWEKMMTFGSISAGIMMIIMIFNLLKLILDAVIRGYTLYSIYGWSVRIFGACFASITALLIHLGDTNSTENPRSQNNVEMNQIRYSEVPTEPPAQKTPPVYPSLETTPTYTSEPLRQKSSFP